MEGFVEMLKFVTRFKNQFKTNYRAPATAPKKNTGMSYLFTKIIS